MCVPESREGNVNINGVAGDARRLYPEFEPLRVEFVCKPTDALVVAKPRPKLRHVVQDGAQRRKQRELLVRRTKRVVARENRQYPTVEG